MANETIIINDDLRTMQIPSSIVLLGVESDDDVNKIPFQMPKEYCGFDLSEFEARINYLNANGEGDIYIVDDLEVDGDDPSLMTFTWLVGRTACAYKGDTKFIVCLKKFDADQNVVQEFNTTVYSLPVLEGLETTEAVVQQNADIIEYILTKIEEAGIIDLSNYYTKTEVNALKLPNPFPLNINGTAYDGSETVEMTIEGGSAANIETASGTIVHVEDAVAGEAMESLTLYNSSGDVINSANVCIANKNLFRLDQIAAQTVSKGVTFNKNADGGIQAVGTSTGTYAAAQCAIDPRAFVVGETYTISSGKKSGILYVQLILNYTDGTTDYLVSSNSPHTFTLAKPVSSVTGSVQITNSGVTVNEWIYPMVELSDQASPFVKNTYTSMTYDGSTMPVLPDSICNIWSNNSGVNDIVMEYLNDPVMAKVNELEQQFYNSLQHDDSLKADSENAVQNKVVTAELAKKIAYPASGAVGQVLAKTTDGAVWSNAGAPTDAQATAAVEEWLDNHPEATTTVEDGSISVDKLANDTIAMINKKSGLTEDVKQALLACFAKVAWIDDEGQTYVDALEEAMYPATNLASISATFNQGVNVIYDTDDLDDLEQYLTVVANYTDSTHETIYDYVLSGTLEAGTSVITVSYGGKTTTFNVTVTAIEVSSISAVYTQRHSVYESNSLDSLKSDLVVTALYSDASTETVPSADYTLSGTLEAGTSTITVSYSGKTTTFNVTVTSFPSGYTKYDYIEKNFVTEDRSSIISTGLTGIYCSPSYGHEFEFSYESTDTSASSPLYGLRATSGATKSRGLWLKNKLAYNYNGSDSGFAIDVVPNTKYNVKTTNGKVYLDDNEVGTTSGSYTEFTSTSDIRLFGYGTNTAGTGATSAYGAKTSMKIYYFKVWNESTNEIVGEFIPCTNANGQAGFYDLVSEQFRTASDPSKLTAGNDA